MITGLPTFTDGEIPTHTKLNLLASILTAKFAGGITGSDIKYPLKLAGDIDLNNNDIINIGLSLGGVRFADDFASIQGAINDLPETGGAVFLSNKTYSTASTINLSGNDGTIRTNVLLLGSGQSSIVQQSGANPVVKLGASGNSVTNLSVDMNSGTGVGIETNSSSWGRVSRVRVYNGGAASVCVDLKNDENSRISDCLLLSGYGVRLQQTTGLYGPYYITGNKMVGTAVGVYLDSPDAAYVTDNSITTSTGIGVYVKLRPYTTESGVTITRNIISAASQGIYLDTQGAPFAMINGNVISDATIGIELVSTGNSRGVCITGNTFISLQSRGIKCTAGAAATTGLSIVNNTFSTCSLAGGTQYNIELNGGSAISRLNTCIIASNNFFKGAPAPTYFISIGANCENLLIAHNVGDQVAATVIDPSALVIVQQSNLWQA